jgi:arabinan endo-1,5-alpha-L-arabinosidase
MDPRPSLSRRASIAARLVAATFALTALLGAVAAPASAADRVYRNPIKPAIPGDGTVGSCADPSVMYGQEGEGRWYMYCTTDPLNDGDRNTSGDFNFHLIPMFESSDLVHWTYKGDAFSARPSWVRSDAGLWAPEVVHLNGEYYLYFTASDTVGGSSAIGVATGPTPLGPWTDSGDPVVDPLPDGRWAFDPDVITNTDGSHWLLFGSYYGGIKARELTADGTESIPATQVDITIDNRYEGAEVQKHGAYYYLFASATNCCNGPLTGYAVFVGRSVNPLGPYVDREGVSLLASRVGGTPAIYQNGNRWVGTGHNSVFTDFAGQTWTMYHAVNVNDPYFVGAPGFTKRPPLLDAIDWVSGWPMLNGGRGPSNTVQPAPAAQPGQTNLHRYIPARPDRIGARIDGRSDEFSGTSVSSRWTWIRQPAASRYSVSGGQFHFDTQAADLYVDSNDASVLTEPAPAGNYVVQTKVHVNVPEDGCCWNYVQAGLVIYASDNSFVKLVNVSIWNTRQTEFAKEVAPTVPSGYPRYGNTVVGPTGEWTWLRIVKRTISTGAPGGLYGGTERYTAYTSHDGVQWSKGGSWTHHLGSGSKIGLVSMGGSGFTADFDYVRVYRLAN